jgi:hypothetical protein
MRKSNKRKRSGQIIAVSALVIALIMTSTATYIYELSGNVGDVDSYVLNDFVSSIELGSKHAVISALANITNGGQNQTLTTNLNNWRTSVEQQYSLGKLTLNYALRGTSPYSSGLYISWSANGNGVSEAYVTFQLNASGRETEMQRPYAVNVSTRLHVEGVMAQISPSSKQVTIVCRLFNDGQSTLAKNLIFYYRESSQWIEAVNGLVITNYGNGTYRATFNAETTATSLDVSVRVFDLRNILAQTNATCLQQ